MDLQSLFSANARWATSDEMDSLVHGDVKEPESLDRRTFIPEPLGLFDEDIFGKLSIEGHEPKEQFQHVRDVFESEEVDEDSPLASRFGEILLPIPILHPHYITRDRDSIAAATGWSLAELDAVLAGRLGMEQDTGALVPPKDYDLSILTNVATINAVLGADSQYTIERVLVVPVLARPLVRIDKRFATSNLNDLYRRVINRRNRYQWLIEHSAPEIITRSEERMLFESIVSLYDNANLPKPITHRKNPLPSLMELATREGERSTLEKLAARRAIEAMGFTLF